MRASCSPRRQLDVRRVPLISSAHVTSRELDRWQDLACHVCCIRHGECWTTHPMTLSGTAPAPLETSKYSCSTGKGVRSPGQGCQKRDEGTMRVRNGFPGQLMHWGGWYGLGEAALTPSVPAPPAAALTAGAPAGASGHASWRRGKALRSFVARGGTHRVVRIQVRRQPGGKQGHGPRHAGRSNVRAQRWADGGLELLRAGMQTQHVAATQQPWSASLS